MKMSLGLQSVAHLSGTLHRLPDPVKCAFFGLNAWNRFSLCSTQILLPGIPYNTAALENVCMTWSSSPCLASAPPPPPPHPLFFCDLSQTVCYLGKSSVKTSMNTTRMRKVCIFAGPTHVGTIFIASPPVAIISFLYSKLRGLSRGGGC